MEQARAAACDGAQLVEWRIDHLAEEPDALVLVRRLLAGSALPCIVTCRPTWEGGHYDGDESRRVALFEAIGTGDHAPRYLDVELAAWSRSANLRQKIKLVVDHANQPRGVTTALMLSSHDFHGRPPDLLQRFEAMTSEPACAASKIAWRARSLRDNLEAFELLRARRGPTVALCMGEFGLPSRVLAKKFGALLTFAAPDGGRPTASGQPTVNELRRRWRFDSIGGETRLYGVIGWPVAHSRSPVLHNSGFDVVGHDGVYLPLPIPPAWEHFKATVGALVDDPHLGFRGASVTAPHKEHLIRLVRERGGRVHAVAEAIGAANTLAVGDDGMLACTNTDAEAARATLIEEGGLDPAILASSRVAVIGAGGAARAVALHLAGFGATVVIFNRTAARASSSVWRTSWASRSRSRTRRAAPRGTATTDRADGSSRGAWSPSRAAAFRSWSTAHLSAWPADRTRRARRCPTSSPSNRD
jgi:3-dehydroquinate dehydratase/shikimate dehydrogenase